MGLDAAMTAYRATRAEARRVPAIIVKHRERRQRHSVESAAEVDHAALGRLAGLRDELRHRGIVPPEIRGRAVIAHPRGLS